jgi:predicted ATP-dependent protease
VVGHPHSGGAPVVFEPHPTYENLFGRIEYSTDQGALYTTYRQLRPGALHRANGGFLILEAEKCSVSRSCGTRSSAPCNRAS